MAKILNPNAPLFFPAAATDELSLIYSPCRLPPSQPFPAFNKFTVFFHPSLIYYNSPSPLALFPNFSYYIPPPKYSFPAIIEPDAAELAGDVPRLGDELVGAEHQRFPHFPVELKAMEEQRTRTVTSSRLAIRGLRGRYGGRQWLKQSPQLWVRKSSSSEDKSAQDSTFTMPDDFQFCDGAKSTVMIKNIPNKLSRRQMLDLLDQHCRIENQKIKEDGADMAFSEFDFLYLPMDFISGNNLGYAFVNFTSPVAAKRLYQYMHMMPWNAFGSRKTCEITHAKIQGFEELVKHFKRSIFTCSTPDYLPVYFQPSRDGSRDSAEQLVGKLVQRSVS